MRPNTKADVYKRIDMRGRNECWPWLGYVNPGGYAVVRMRGKHCQVHRLVYEWEYGPIPDGWEWTIDHICFNTICLNPRHLRLMPRSQNSARKEIHETNVCKRGHDLLVTGRVNSKGRRICRECAAVNQAAYKERIASGETVPKPQTSCIRGHGAEAMKQYANGQWYCSECKRITNKKPPKPKTHCRRGHEYATDGKVEADGSLRCVTCHNDRRRERYAAQRAS